GAGGRPSCCLECWRWPPCWSLAAAAEHPQSFTIRERRLEHIPRPSARLRAPPRISPRSPCVCSRLGGVIEEGKRGRTPRRDALTPFRGEYPAAGMVRDSSGASFFP